MFSSLTKLNGDKALEPDGFSMAIWQFSWDVVKDEMMGMIMLIRVSCY